MPTWYPAWLAVDVAVFGDDGGAAVGGTAAVDVAVLGDDDGGAAVGCETVAAGYEHLGLASTWIVDSGTAVEASDTAVGKKRNDHIEDSFVAVDGCDG